MSFYPDGETRIPEQTPVPGSRPATPEEQGRRRSRLLVRTAAINTVILAAAVLAAYVFPVSDDEDVAIAIVLVAAMLSASHMAFVLLRDQRRTQEEQRAARVAVADAATTTYPSVDAPVADTAVAPTAVPYGSIADGVSGFLLEIEDVFSITGRGTVVTGRVAAGRVTVGQPVRLVRDGIAFSSTEVTGIEMFRRTESTAETGDNVGLLLRGVTRAEVRRGDLVQG